MCSYVLLTWVELITFAMLLASYLATRFQAVDPTLYVVASLGFAVFSRKLANQNLCKTNFSAIVILCKT